MTKAERAARKERNDAVISGVLIALGCVYTCRDETSAEEIIRTVGAADILRVAKREEDCYLPSIRHTVRFLKSVGGV